MKTGLLALAVAAGLTAFSAAGCKDNNDAMGPESGDEPAPITVCVVRHAEAFSNLETPPEGMAGEGLDALTDTGKEQARAARTRLPEAVTVVWTSPRNRTRQTAAALSLTGAAVQVVPELAPLRGKIAWSDRLANWKAGKDPQPPGGESLADGQRRVATALNRLGAMLEPGETAVLVTHSDIAPLLIGQLRGTPLLERPANHAFGLADVKCAPLSAP